MIKQDYKAKSSRASRAGISILHRIRLRWGEITAVSVGVFLLALALSSGDEDVVPPVKPIQGEINLNTPEPSETVVSSEPSSKQARYELPLQWQEPKGDVEALSPSDETTPETLSKQRSVDIKSGDTLSAIFQSQGFSARDVYRVTQDPLAEKTLRSIRPGKTLLFETDHQQQLIGLYYEIAVNETLQIKKQGENFVAEIKKRPIEIRQAFASGVINDSLFAAGKDAGLSDSLIVKLANIFGWDIDFVLDVRKNDSFAMIYETKFLDGEYIGEGEIVAAQFINQGEVFQAVRYVDSQGNDNFFTPEGKSMRKAFLRAPVNFLYISSNFKPRRFHPILKRWKAHRGIDYRAPTGTPILAAGDGKVIASSSNKYNGKYVFIQHGNNIVTKYLHMSRRAVSNGKRVKQGQVIGYVGATGLAEAPHLHYEFLVGGVHRNPRTVKLPEALPVAKSERERFKQQTQSLLASLESYQKFQTTAVGQ
ncbi:peptidoglycan DD-metalloendopeptidase family protein [Pleionea litopenaei]|uniref:Peptidoglycan DD-metalloendopeptidase family protein n=1 Tax=Pleionea litopenaei TaxID=3070815 RepID=A0AA51X8M2_9GAMM|nr:peptidoglycan DD-metalloendopeptidase family protein [Pleionea sp. HL-JVS1]WMS89126.1 peptidoglycan DD-metalloendopeptidase family protein [Pleionea sp. HL-JVS1]